MSRKDPNDTPVDGAPEFTKVEGKDPEFHYVWLHPKDDARRLGPRGVGKDRIAGFEPVKLDGAPEEFAGYGAIRGASALGDYVTNGELVLCRQPMAAKVKADARQHAEALDVERRIKGPAFKGAPIKITESKSQVTT